MGPGAMLMRVAAESHLVEAQRIDSRRKLNPQHISAFGAGEPATFREVALSRACLI